jgi:hypothetical protein
MPLQQHLWLNDDEGLLPAPNYLGQQDQEYAVRPGTGRPFHLSPQDDQLLTRTSHFLPQAQTCSCKVGQGTQQERCGVRFCPGDEAVVE